MWALEAQLLDEPFGIVAKDEGRNRRTDLVETAKDAAMDDLLLEGAVEALGDAVGLRLGDEREAGRDAPKAQLIEEMVREVLRPMVHPDRQAARNVSSDRAIVLQNSHRERLERREAVAELAHVIADALDVEVLDGDEYPAPPVLDGEHPRAVGSPHDVRRIGRDSAVVQLGLAQRPTMRREQVVLPHEPEHTLTTDAHAVEHA